MRHWTIEGADRRNGDEMVAGIDAFTEAEARQIAAGRDILVSSIYESAPLPPEAVVVTDDIPATHMLEYSGPKHRSDRASLPDYSDIILRQKTVRTLANTARILGFVNLAMAGLFVIWPIVEARGLLSIGGWIGVVTTALPFTVAGVAMLIAAAALKLLAAVAMVIRDIAVRMREER